MFCSSLCRDLVHFLLDLVLNVYVFGTIINGFSIWCFVCCLYCMVALKQVNKFFDTLLKGWSLVAFLFKMVGLSVVVLLINRMWQKWCCMTSDSKSRKLMYFLTPSLGTFAFETQGHMQRPWDKMKRKMTSQSSVGPAPAIPAPSTVWMQPYEKPWDIQLSPSWIQNAQKPWEMITWLLLF